MKCNYFIWSIEDFDVNGLSQSKDKRAPAGTLQSKSSAPEKCGNIQHSYRHNLTVTTC